MINGANLTILNKKRNFTLFKYDFKPITSKGYAYKGHTSDKTTMQKRFKLGQPITSNVEKKRQTAFMILEDYHYDILNM